jgi:alkanesulfonate monooxygenase SsuD/methylene tetrahydromethanopterin reductase-like flavin-dependent oxidoreductase (luciferase family)
MMGTHIAARTERLRIGTAVSLTPFYHPLRLAEEVALLDVLSGGRVNWGAGRGFDETEYRSFGVEREDSYPLFRENVEIVMQAWTSGRLTYHGKYHDFEDVEVLPKPIQQPHPPVWLASTSKEAIKWSAQHGYSILMDPHASHADIAIKRALYETELIKAGHSIQGRVIPMARNIALGRSQSEAEDVARRGAQFMFGSYLPPGVGAANPSKSIPADAKSAPQQDRVERYVKEVVICGTPEKVIDDLHELEGRLPLDYLMCTPLSHESFELFTEKVMPRFL